jgi:hypothetical protein
MRGGATDFTLLRTGGKELLIAYAPIQSTGWSLGNVVEAKAVFQAVGTFQVYWRDANMGAYLACLRQEALMFFHIFCFFVRNPERILACFTYICQVCAQNKQIFLYFLEDFAKKYGKKAPTITRKAIEILENHSWPGNVRQLEQALLATTALCEGDEIVPGHFPAWFREAVTSAGKQEITCLPTNPSLETRPRPEKDNRLLKDEDRRRYLEALDATKYQGTGRGM